MTKSSPETLVRSSLDAVAARDDVALAPSAVPTVASAVLALVPLLSASEPMGLQRLRQGLMVLAGVLIERGISAGSVLALCGGGGLAALTLAWRELDVWLRRRQAAAAVKEG